MTDFVQRIERLLARTLAREHDRLAADLAAASHRAEQATEAARAMLQKAESLEATIASHTQEASRLREDLAESARHRDADRAAAQARLDEIDVALGNFKGESVRLAARVSELLLINQHLTSELGQSSELEARTQEQVSHLECRLHSALQNFDALEARRSALEQSLREANDAVTTAKSDLEIQRQKTALAEAEVANALDREKKAAAEIDELHSRLTALESKSEAEKAAFARQSGLARAALAVAQSETETARQGAALSAKQAQEAEEREDRAAKQLEQLRAQIDEMSAQIACIPTLEENLNRARIIYDETLAQLITMRAENDELFVQRSQQEWTIETLRWQEQSLREEIDRIGRENSGAKQAREEAQRRLDEIKAEQNLQLRDIQEREHLLKVEIERYEKKLVERDELHRQELKLRDATLVARETELERRLATSAEDAERERAAHQAAVEERQELQQRLSATTQSAEVEKAALEAAQTELAALRSQQHKLAERVRIANDEIAHASKLLQLYRVPGIIFNTLPKSGSVYITTLLSKGLSIKFQPLTNSYFPFDVINRARIAELSEGNVISQDHFPPTDINLHYVRQFTDRIVLHTRDPRQAALSWAHHLRRLKDGTLSGAQPLLDNVFPKLPSGYFERDLSGQLDWVIDHHLPLLVEWLSDWLRVVDDPKAQLRILLTRFEDFVDDPRGYCDALLDFHNIPRLRLVWAPPQKSTVLHFRKGEQDEWRTVFSPAQQRRAASLLPKPLLKRLKYT